MFGMLFGQQSCKERLSFLPLYDMSFLLTFDRGVPSGGPCPHSYPGPMLCGDTLSVSTSVYLNYKIKWHWSAEKWKYQIYYEMNFHLIKMILFLLCSFISLSVQVSKRKYKKLFILKNILEWFILQMSVFLWMWWEYGVWHHRYEGVSLQGWLQGGQWSVFSSHIIWFTLYWGHLLHVVRQSSGV